MSNNYTNALVRTLRARYSVENVGMTTSDWICANTRQKGKPFSFEGYEFQRAIADDLHPNMDVLKISQVGLTEVQMRKALALIARNPGMVGIFSLPNEKMYKRFYQSRLKPVIEDNPVFNSNSDAGAVRSIDLVQMGHSFLNIVNATEGSATSTSADFVFNDEVDLSDQKALALFSSRLQNSTFKIKQRFSTPSWQGFGIDATYAASDQREYHCRCHACGRWEVPLWHRDFVRIRGLPDSCALEDINDEIVERLDLENSYVMCKHCASPLDLDHTSRHWVATFPERTHARGYRVRPFSSGRISIPYIVRELLSYRRQDFIRGWHNTVIGEPYSDARARLDESQIRALLASPKVPEIGSDVPVFIGVDMGMVCHLTLGTPRGNKMSVFDFRVVHQRDILTTISEILNQYNVINGTCDRHPYTPTAEEMRDISDGRIMPMEYRGETDFKPVKDPEDVITHWQMNRTRGIDAVAKRVRLGQYEFNGYGDQQRIIIEHLRDMIREETPETAAKWKKLNGVDHYFHSLVFLEAAFQLNSAWEKYEEIDMRSMVFFGGAAAPAMDGLPGMISDKSKQKYRFS